MAKSYVPYGERPGFGDVSPILQDDGPSPPVNIAYSPQFIDTMNYFRAFYAADERSERAFAVTAAVIALNPANYSAWHLRRLCLAVLRPKLENCLRDELSFVEGLIMESPKNYQIWFHRRWLVEQLQDWSREMYIVERLLDMDSKNYHRRVKRSILKLVRTCTVCMRGFILKALH
jgi:protein farnesyltransferase/geranylgeranyltransferase type-1 subunit alpha